ncbi:MAG: site-2 protease family protein [Desulfatibacillaceae bacterium]
MFGRKLNLFSIFGFQVSIDLSWVIIAILVAWSLSTGWFPFQYEDLSTRTYWIMGVIGALGLFVSILVHEFAHSMVARSFGQPMRGITLFIFGGIAESGGEARTPGQEFFVAIVGPVTSVLLAGTFYLAYRAGVGSGLADPVNGVLGYLALINLVLAVFNMIPAYPLDGGRVLRSILWKVKGNVKWATRIASEVGAGFGVVLIVLGIFAMLAGNVVGGLWRVLIGMFLHGIARGSYQQLVVRRALEGEPLSRFMRRDPVVVSPDLTLDRFVEDYVYQYHFKMFPVVSEDRLAGMVTTRDVKEVPREQWSRTRVEDVARPCMESNTLSPDTDAMEALSTMSRSGQSRMIVMENGRLEGVVTLKDMTEFLSLKVDMEE